MATKTPRAAAVLSPTGLQISANDAQHLVPAAMFSSMPGWDKLNADEQTVVQTEGVALAQALLVNGASRLAIGEHLTNLQGTLEPHNLFGRFLRSFKFSKRTAYRFISGFKNAKARLPEPILKAAMARGINLLGDNDQKPLGIYTEAAKRLPPPQNPDPTQVNAWLDSVEQVRKDVKQEAADAEGTDAFVMPEPTDPATAMKECFRFVSNRYKQLPTTPKVRANWMRGLIGILLAEFGVSSMQQFQPQAVPEDFRVVRGRPKENKVAAGAA